MKLLGASLLCLGLMMAEGEGEVKGRQAKFRYSQPLPTAHKPQIQVPDSSPLS